MAKRRFVAAAALVLAWSSPSAADIGDFEGTWMHVGDRYGFIASYIEQVDVSFEGEVSVRLFTPPVSDAGCEDGVTGGICDKPRETIRGKLKSSPSAGLLMVVEPREIAPAFPDPPYNPFYREAWQVLGFAGPIPWNYELDGDVLRISRLMPAGSDQPELVKTYHRVDLQMPADLHDFLMVMSLSIFKAGCALDAIQADADMRAEFRQLIADIAPLARGGEGTAAREHFEWLKANPASNDALFPGAESALPQIRACIDEML
jgi:hypothetical protein